MFERFKAKRPGTPLRHMAAYQFLQWMFCLILTTVYRCRVFRSHRVPAGGAVLIVANHQSYMDPPLIGMPVRQRHLDYVARIGLFESRWFGVFIGALNATPIRDQGGGDVGAMRLILGRLAEGRAVVIFPEGSRTHDGAIHEFKRGAAVLLKRSRCPVIPVAVEGCFDAWPRFRRIPRLLGCRVAVAYGRPVEHDVLLADGPEAAMARLHDEVEHLRLCLRRLLRMRSSGRFPPHGPGDVASFTAREAAPKLAPQSPDGSQTGEAGKSPSSAPR